MILSETELKRLQSLEVDMFRVFIEICEKLNLRYYVLGGTLLGAVRHGGFIPWDDDIDVGMPREDYEVFLQKASSLLPPHLFLQNYRTDSEYCLNITKIRNTNTTSIENESRQPNICHGVFLDIFPLDHYPGTALAELWYKVKRRVLKVRIGKAFVWDDKPNPFKELLKKPLDLIWPDVKQAVEEREKLFRSFSYSGMIANFCGQWGEKEIVPAEWYAEACELEFEGLTVKAPKEYHKWLTQVYGDYMQLPPVEKRVTHHRTLVIDLDRPYSDFIDKGNISR